MNTKQTIAIIGATGNVGTFISKSLSKGNYRLLLLGNQPDELEALYEEIRNASPEADIEIHGCPTDASWEADIIILAVPYGSQQEIAEKIREVANQKMVISIANPLNEPYDSLATVSNMSAAEELQKLLPNSKVVKAFNIVFPAAFAKPILVGKKANSFIS